ncbi:G2/M phase-specific E3 ubiquitin-protein ligase [Exaiptasia diaphana]|nr:G2/M phase-specific E3 ubiquitin-protein ligase [Exaiptasia diaphana]
MSAEDIQDEICSLFKDCFAADGLNYSYLSIMPGTKKLHIPKTTKAFVWDAPQVLSICTRDTLYILSSSNPINDVSKNESVSDEDSSDESLMHPVFGDSKGNTCRNENADANISSSSNIFSDNSQTLTPITDILDKLQAPLTESNSVSSINIRRQFVLEDTIRFLKRKRFDQKTTISVRFADDHGVGEGAIDAGGPRREFLRLLVKAVNEQSGVFCGPIDGRTLQANASAREKDLYRFTGTILAWAIVHGGPAPSFFSTSLYNALSSNGVTVVRKEDIADPSLKECVQKPENIASSSNLEELRKNLSVPEISTILEAQGVATALIKSIDDKDWLCNLIVRHIIVDAPRSFLEDLKSGLETLGVLQKLHEFQEEFRDIFVPSKSNSKIDAQTIDSLFVIDYAEMGSNLRSKQEIAVVYWRDYLQDCECM